MSSQNCNISTVFFALAAILALWTGMAQAEERSQDEQREKHFYQPGQGYEQEPEYKFSGVIRKMPVSGVAGIWIINDRPILVTPMTVLKEEQGKAVVGASVEVKGVLQRMDFVATEIEVKGSNKH